MRWTQTLIPTLKETPQEAESAGHKLLLRAGLCRMLVSGVYTYLPLGLRVLDNIEQIIRQEMAAAGAAELLLPALQPLELWQRTGRDQALGEVMLRFTDRRGRKLCLGPTHEEVITELAKNHISSYRQLPLILYQIQAKFRDEIRPRFGLVRSCEFVMKDAYSFDKDQAGLERNYKLMLEAYQNIFRRCGLDFLVIEADPGVMGGAVSHEFMVPAESGEDAAFSCPKCEKALGFKEGALPACPGCKGQMQQVACLEVGHIFQLGTKYSSALGANFLDEKGKLQPIIMGCYGIGVSRLISAVIEQNHDQNGIIWPKEVAPYQALIVALDTGDAGISREARVIYSALQKAGINVLWDDREERAGVKFKDADLIGIPVQIIVGKNTLKDGTIEIKLRGKEEKRVVKKEEALKSVLILTKEKKDIVAEGERQYQEGKGVNWREISRD